MDIRKDWFYKIYSVLISIGVIGWLALFIAHFLIDTYLRYFGGKH